MSERFVPDKRMQLALSGCHAGPLTEEIFAGWQIAELVVSIRLLLTPVKAESECLQLLSLQSIADVVVLNRSCSLPRQVHKRTGTRRYHESHRLEHRIA